MFKKSLVALALISASSGAFAAADITATVEKDISIEGSASLANVRSNVINVVLGAEYSVGDIITFNFSGGELDETTIPATIDVDMTPINGTDSMTLGLLNSTDTSITFRVTELDTAVGGTTIDAEINIVDTLEFDRDSVISAGDVTVSYAAATSTNIAIDTGDDSSTELFATTSQFSLDRSSDADFDAVIDVEDERLEFTDTDTIDAVEITFQSATGLAYAVVDADDTYEVVLNGNFAYLDSDEDTDGIQLAANSSIVMTGAVGGDGAPSELTATTATWDAVDVAAAGDTITITIDSDGAADDSTADVVIPVQAFTVDVNVTYDDFGTDVTASGTAQATTSDSVGSALSLGEWSLNGSVVEIPFLPFGPVTEPILRHTNVGAQTGDITLRYMVEGEHTTYQDGGTIVSQATPGVRNLLGQVTNALLADGYDATVNGFKVAIELTTNVPADDVKVTAAAKFTTTDSDRLSIGVISSQ